MITVIRWNISSKRNTHAATFSFRNILHISNTLEMHLFAIAVTLHLHTAHIYIL